MHFLCHIFMTLGLNFNTNSFGAPSLKKIKIEEELEKKISLSSLLGPYVL